MVTIVLTITNCSTTQKPKKAGTTPPSEKINVQGNSKITSFTKAKKLLPSLFSKSTDRTFYCGCKFTGKVVDWNSCGYKPKGSHKRAKRIEWEHVVPAAAFGGNLPEWRNGHSKCQTSSGKKYKGRRCASKVNGKFNYMESDLYNLVPAIGEVNGLRSNYSIGMISGEARLFGKCDVEIKNKMVEPRPEIRGDMARVYLYMDTAYPGLSIINKSNRALIHSWDRSDPVSKEECDRAISIHKIQGNLNHVLKSRCKD